MRIAATRQDTLPVAVTYGLPVAVTYGLPVAERSPVTLNLPVSDRLHPFGQFGPAFFRQNGPSTRSYEVRDRIEVLSLKRQRKAILAVLNDGCAGKLQKPACDAAAFVRGHGQSIRRPEKNIPVTAHDLPQIRVTIAFLGRSGLGVVAGFDGDSVFVTGK